MRAIPLVLFCGAIVLAGCAQEKNDRNSQPAALSPTTLSDDRSTNLALLDPPTAEDLEGLELLYAGQQLGRVAVIADSYEIGYHKSPTVSDEEVKLSEAAFFADFWQGKYDTTPTHIEAYESLAELTPGNPVVQVFACLALCRALPAAVSGEARICRS